MISLLNKEKAMGPPIKMRKKARHRNEFPHLKMGVASTNYSPPNGTDVISYLCMNIPYTPAVPILLDSYYYLQLEGTAARRG